MVPISRLLTSEIAYIDLDDTLLFFHLLVMPDKLGTNGQGSSRAGPRVLTLSAKLLVTVGILNFLASQWSN